MELLCALEEAGEPDDRHTTVRRARHGSGAGEVRRQDRRAKTARKGRQKKVEKSTDGRSLRATGRTELVNFRAHPRVKQAIADHIPKGKISLWLEEAIIAKLQAEGVKIDA